MSTDRSLRQRWLSIALAAVLVVAIAGLVVYVVVPVPATPPDTEFYLLNENGTQAAYPDTVTVGESATVVVGVENHEYEAVSYRLEVGEDGRFAERSVTLSDGERWTHPVSVSFESSGRKEVDVHLYRDTVSSPYRTLRLRLTVEPNGG